MTTFGHGDGVELRRNEHPIWIWVRIHSWTIYWNIQFKANLQIRPLHDCHGFQESFDMPSLYVSLVVQPCIKWGWIFAASTYPLLRNVICCHPSRKAKWALSDQTAGTAGYLLPRCFESIWVNNDWRQILADPEHDYLTQVAYMRLPWINTRRSETQRVSDSAEAAARHHIFHGLIDLAYRLTAKYSE